jgi:hypothetical protein
MAMMRPILRGIMRPIFSGILEPGGVLPPIGGAFTNGFTVGFKI